MTYFEDFSWEEWKDTRICGIMGDYKIPEKPRDFLVSVTMTDLKNILLTFPHLKTALEYALQASKSNLVGWAEVYGWHTLKGAPTLGAYFKCVHSSIIIGWTQQSLKKWME